MACCIAHDAVLHVYIPGLCPFSFPDPIPGFSILHAKFQHAAWRNIIYRLEVGLEMDLPGFIKSMYLRFIVTFFFLLQRIEGCVCINPGRLTKKASGGTFVKVFVPDAPTIKDDFSSDIAVQIVYI